MLPPLRKKMPQERAAVRLTEGEDLTFALFGERAILGDDASGAMSEATEWRVTPEPPEDEQSAAIRALVAAVAEQTEALKRIGEHEEMADLERLLAETKALTYGKPGEHPGGSEDQPGADSGDGKETLYP